MAVDHNPWIGVAALLPSALGSTAGAAIPGAAVVCHNQVHIRPFVKVEHTGLDASEGSAFGSSGTTAVSAPKVVLSGAAVVAFSGLDASEGSVFGSSGTTAVSAPNVVLSGAAVVGFSVSAMI